MRIPLLLLAALGIAAADMVVTQYESVECEVVDVDEGYVSTLVPGLGYRLFPVNKVVQILLSTPAKTDYLRDRSAGYGIRVGMLVEGTGDTLPGAISRREVGGVQTDRGQAGDTLAGAVKAPSASMSLAVNPAVLQEAGTQLQGARSMVYWGIGLTLAGSVISGLIASDTTISLGTKIAVPIAFDLAAVISYVIAWTRVGEAGTALRYAAIPVERR